jgi:hypothetical protein
MTAALISVIVSDGPDPEFLQACPPGSPHSGYAVISAALPDHDPGSWWGEQAKNTALKLSRGQLIAWLDDDDEYLPGHLTTLAGALRPGDGFAFSRLFPACLPTPNSGDNPGLGNVLARRELAEQAPFRHTIYDGWDVMQRWIAAGARWTCAGKPTIRVHIHADYTPGDGYPAAEGDS